MMKSFSLIEEAVFHKNSPDSISKKVFLMKSFLLAILLVLTLSSGAIAGNGGLEEALKKYLLANSRWPDAAITLENVEVMGGVLPTRGFTSYRISSRNKAFAAGRVSFNVALLKGERTVASAVVMADVGVLRSVVVTARPIRMREQIGVGDVRLERVNISVIPAAAALTLAEVVGKAAKRPLSAGRVVRTDYLQRPRMVKRGQSLDVRVEGASIMVRARATAISDGFLGSPIKARTSGGREISGLVSGPGQMVVNFR